MIEQFYLTPRWDSNRYYYLGYNHLVDLGVMAMKGYSMFTKSQELEPHHQMQFSFIPKTLVVG